MSAYELEQHLETLQAMLRRMECPTRETSIFRTKLEEALAWGEYTMGKVAISEKVG